MSQIKEFVKLFNEANPAEKITDEEYHILELYQDHLDEQEVSQPTPVRSDVAFTCAKCHEVNTNYDGDVCWKCDTPRRSTS